MNKIDNARISLLRCVHLRHSVFASGHPKRFLVIVFPLFFQERFFEFVFDLLELVANGHRGFSNRARGIIGDFGDHAIENIGDLRAFVQFLFLPELTGHDRSFIFPFAFDTGIDHVIFFR